MNFHSLRFRLIWIHSAAIAILVFCIGLARYHLISYRSQRSFDAALLSDAQFFVSRFEYGRNGFALSTEGLTTGKALAMQELEHYFIVTDLQGRVLHQDLHNRLIQNLLLGGNLNVLLHQKDGFYNARAEDGSMYRFVSLPMHSGISSQEAIMHIGRSVEPHKSLLREYLIFYIYSVPMILAISVVAGWFLVRHALKPFEEITRTAERITHENLNTQIFTERKDYSYLCDQIGNDIGLRGKKVLLIGGGSLGSYIAVELVKNGVASLTVYDKDLLSDENILRWAFCGFGIRGNKAILLKIQLEYFHPEIRVKAMENNIDAKTLVEMSDQVDMIVFAIGSSDSQLAFNRTLKEISCHTPVIYTWLEAGGNYSHILTVDYTKRGCYECLYTNEKGESVNNRASRNNNDLDVSIIRNGCGGTRAAYGSAVLLRTTAALLGTIQKMLLGELNENTLIDITPESVNSSSQLIPMEACRCCGNKSE